MSAPRSRGRAPRTRPALIVGALALAGVLIFAGALVPAGSVPGAARVASATAQPSTEAPLPQTDASVPASGVTMIGATPLEAPGADETWAIGEAGSTTVLVRYSKQGGEGAWTLGSTLPSGFKLDKSPLAGQMTPGGVGALVGTGTESNKVLLVRKPGGAFEATASVPAEGAPPGKGEEPLLRTGEVLFGATRAPLLAPLEEEGGGAGALLVPVVEGQGVAVEHQVLHWDGHKWSSEQIEIPAKSKSDFRALAIGASASQNAWLLAQLSFKSSYPAGAVALFRRVREGEGEGAKWVWKPVAAAGGEAGEAEPLKVPVKHAGASTEVEPFTVPGAGEQPTVTGQLLTVTSEGVWIDGERSDVQTLTPATTTLFFRPEGATAGRVQASWCLLPASVPSGTPECEHELPEALPNGPYRSIAWAKSGAEFGERVITGLPEGVSLSLRGAAFERVLGLGSGGGAAEDPGAAHGAAFTTPQEGWLGAGLMPIHLASAHELAPSRLAPWPTSFRHPLLAIAPQPGAPVGALTSEALAVGDRGAVARFKPGEGWLPESLFGPGQRVEHPRLRAVAWPTPTRAYAVGDYASHESNMWLWRAETGLWEPDPATPLNFRGDLLGIAFDPNNPARGYAVGSSTTGEGEVEGRKVHAEGVLLRYGKTWTQETALPPQVQGASFIGVAFAGSEAIVAYRQRLSAGVGHTSGGLIVNEGSGWRVDEQAATVIAGAVPAAVAGLTDGGAAFTTIRGPEGPRVYEREAAGSPWQPTPAPLPGLGAGSLTLFREAGALRAIVSAGGVANEGEPTPPPPGFPPNFLGPLAPVGGGPQTGGVLRQTASGWRDEGHELNPARESPGNYVYHDLPYRPDPVLAVLVDPTGAQGWAVGGNINSAESGRLETADVERYPADGVAPLGAGASVVAGEVPAHNKPGEAKDATFAIGGGAQCAAPCAGRALAGVGPDVWLTSALARASQTGVRAFLYTGPYVTAGKVNGPRSLVVPFARELERYSFILKSSPLPVYAAVSADELDARPEREGTEQTFEDALLGVEPFGDEVPLSAEQRQACARRVGCEAAYYAFNSAGSGGTVRVIVLDDSSDVEPAQLGWLEQQLESARANKTPAIVLGNADLNAQITAGDVSAGRVAAALVDGSLACQQSRKPCGASAYFYDSPEENVHKPLRSGGESIEAYGSGTLGYVTANNERFGDFHGASGFLLAQVEFAGNGYNPATNRANVAVRLIPNIGELALEAHGGILLRRSSTALFEGLARRPRAGGRAGEKNEESEVDPYIPIPANCVGAACASGLFPEYTFSSSNTDIGGFVKPNLVTSRNPEAVLVNAKGEPEREPVRKEGAIEIEESKSGLFCAYNPGQTTVTISAGGLSASLPVTVEAGSVREPCGTVPLKELPAAQQRAPAPVPAPPPPAPAPGPAQPAPASAPPPVPLPPLPPLAARQTPPRPTLPPPPFVPLAALATPVLAFVPPPLPTPARPTPPTGTSAVTSPIEVAEREEEEEEATEQVSNQAVAYRVSEDEPAAAYLLAVIVLAALAGAAIRRPRRGRRAVRVAPSTLSGMRAQRRLTHHPRRPPRGL